MAPPIPAGASSSQKPAKTSGLPGRSLPNPPQNPLETAQKATASKQSTDAELRTLLASPEPEPTDQANSEPEHGPRSAHPAGIPADSVGATADLQLPTPAARIRPPGGAYRGSRLEHAAVG